MKFSFRFVRQISYKMNSVSTKWVLGHKVTPLQTSADYDLVYGESPAYTPGPPPHTHQNFTEVFVVTEGEMEFMINGEIKILKAGDSINLAPNDLHTFGNKTNAPCKWVNIHSPKGFLSFFQNIGVAVDQENAQERSLRDDKIKEVIATASNYDMVLHL